MVSPPRDRPSASRSLPGLAGLVPAGGGFLSFGGAPRAGRGAQPGHAPAAPGRCPPAAHAAPRRRAGARGPPSHPPRPSTPCPPPHHTRRAAGPGSSPRSHPLTSGDAGYRRSSSSRTAPADPATGIPPGSGGRSRRSPAGDHSTGAPAADDPAATAPAAPTPYRSDHAVSAGPHPRRNPTGNDPSRSMGHALIDVTERRARHPVSGDSAGPPPLDVTLTAPVVDFIAAHGDQVPGRARLRACPAGARASRSRGGARRRPATRCWA